MTDGPRLHAAISCNEPMTFPRALHPDQKRTPVNLAYPVDALVSYHYYKRDDLMAAVTGPGHLCLIGDSGAYSAFSQGEEIRLADYAAWCRQWQDRLAWVAALDVIGNPRATWDNWAAFRERGIESVPTLHAGGDVAWLDRYAIEGVDFVGLGGLVGGAARGFRWMVHVLRWARDHHPGMRFHAWGVTTRKVLDALPVYSADSSGIMGQGYRYGRLRLFDPATGAHVAVDLDGRAVHAHRRLLEGTYGVDPATVATSHPGNRAVLIQMAAASTQQYAAWLQARHQVTPPRWAQVPGPRLHLTGDGNPSTDPAKGALGPRVHVVDAMPRHLAALNPEGDR